MINQITDAIFIPPYLKRKMELLKPYQGGDWNKNDKPIAIFKRIIKSALISSQNDCCAYCGLPFEETDKTEIEHFAPKGGAKRPKHVQFMFEPENLYLSCNLCNSPLKKGNIDTIVVMNNIYAQCSFNIVHPRYDIPDQHYGWVESAEQVLIQSITTKGKASIKMFKLDSPAHNEARARILLHSRYKNLPPDQQSLIREIMGYTQ